MFRAKIVLVPKFERMKLTRKPLTSNKHRQSEKYSAVPRNNELKATWPNEALLS